MNCINVGFISIGWKLGAKGGDLELLVDFRQEDEKVNPRPSVNSWSTPTSEGRRVKDEVPGMKHKRIPEI